MFLLQTKSGWIRRNFTNTEFSKIEDTILLINDIQVKYTCRIIYGSWGSDCLTSGCQTNLRYMGLDVRKPVFGVPDKARLKPVSSATEARWKIKISLVASLKTILSKKRITKALISLRRCAGWSEPLLFANHRRQVFSRRGPYSLPPWYIYYRHSQKSDYIICCEVFLAFSIVTHQTAGY